MTRPRTLHLQQQGLGHLLEAMITHLVTIGVVILFEMVDVAQD